MKTTTHTPHSIPIRLNRSVPPADLHAAGAQERRHEGTAGCVSGFASASGFQVWARLPRSGTGRVEVVNQWLMNQAVRKGSKDN